MQIVLGLAGIAMGLRQITGGLQKLDTSKTRRGAQVQRARPVRRGPQRPLGDLFVNTPSGQIRLRTYNINNLDERIVHLRQLVQAGKRDPAVYEFARRAVNGKCGSSWCVPEKDNLAEMRALFNAVRKNVRYTSDIAGIDSYQKPGHTLSLRTGDCDDYSTLACALASSLGMQCRFKVIKTTDAPTWNHIYAQIGFPRRSPRKWISFDASVPMPFGWEPPANMIADSRVFAL